MSLRCKVGDLAVLVYSEAGNEGLFVEVLYPLGCDPVWRGELWCAGNGHAWLCKLKRPSPSSAGGIYAECPVPDAWLSPIRPPAPEEQTTTSKDLEAV